MTEITLSLGGFSQVLKLSLPVGNETEVFRYMLRKMLHLASPQDIRFITIAQNFSRISEIIGDTDTELLAKLVVNAEIGDLSQDGNWTTIQPPFLLWIERHDNGKLDETVKAIQGVFESLSRDQWQDILKREGSELDLLFAMIETGRISALGAPYYDALLASAVDFIGGAKRPARFGNRWAKLPVALSEAQSSFFYQRLGDELLTRAPKLEVLNGILNLYGEALLRKSDFQTRESAAIRIILDPLLASKNDDAVDAVTTNAPSFASLISRADPSDAEFLATRFLDILKNGDESTREKYSRLAEILGIADKLKVKPSETEDPSET